jgi:hypothetical protein
MTTVRATTRSYDADSGNLVREVEIEATFPDPTPPPAQPTPRPASNVVTLRPVAGCRPDCLACARERRRADSFGFQVRYTPTPTSWLRYTSPTNTNLTDALARVFV